MKKFMYSIAAVALLGLAVAPLLAKEKTGPNILEKYEKVSAALVKDDLTAARKAASDLAETAQAENQGDLAKASTKLAQARDLKQARQQFVSVSKEAIKLAEGEPGYYIMTCPMVKNGDWLQSKEKLANPYMGQKMAQCGKVKQKPTSSKTSKSSASSNSSAATSGCCAMSCPA